MKRLTNIEKNALKDWRELIQAIKTSTNVNSDDSPLVIAERKAKLEKDPEAWFKYYFPEYYTSEPAPFHKKATKRILKHKRWYEVRAWSRELGKSARTMMEVMFLSLTGEVRNVLIISNSGDNATRLLTPIKLQYEANQRIIQDYGSQVSRGNWEADEFVIKANCGYRAIGTGQSPRGTRNKNFRPDLLIFDDVDTDEKCRSKDRIDFDWKWIEEAAIPAMSVSGNRRVIFNGNIIAKDSVIVRAITKAKLRQKDDKGFVDIVNIRDSNGKSSWAKNSEEDIDDFISTVSTAAAQKEFFNNPVVEGEIFKSVIIGKIPPLNRFPFLVVYGDPAPGQKKGSSTKSVILLGKLDGKLYVIKTYLDNGLNTTFIEWYVEMKKYIDNHCPTYYYIENNSLQDPFYEQVFMPIIRNINKERHLDLYIKEDRVKKTDKATRIEADLEPLNSNGKLIFNAAEAQSPHMQRLIDQFKLFSMSLKYPADGPDCVEGGHRVIKSKMQQLDTQTTTVVKLTNKKRL